MLSLYETIFNWHVKAGRELSISDLVVKSRNERGVRSLTREKARLASKKTRKIYFNRWHEIYDTKLGIVHEPAPAPVQKSVPAPEPEPKVDPLAALRKARAKKEEEHE